MESAIVKVSIKWGKEKFDIEVEDPNAPLLDFKTLLYS